MFRTPRRSLLTISLSPLELVSELVHMWVELLRQRNCPSDVGIDACVVVEVVGLSWMS